MSELTVLLITEILECIIQINLKICLAQLLRDNILAVFLEFRVKEALFVDKPPHILSHQ